jgi:hypothetical protein
MNTLLPKKNNKCIEGMNAQGTRGPSSKKKFLKIYFLFITIIIIIFILYLIINHSFSSFSSSSSSSRQILTDVN